MAYINLKYYYYYYKSTARNWSISVLMKLSSIHDQDLFYIIHVFTILPVFKSASHSYQEGGRDDPGLKALDDLAHYLVVDLDRSDICLTALEAETVVSLFNRLSNVDKARTVYSVKGGNKQPSGRWRVPRKPGSAPGKQESER